MSNRDYKKVTSSYRTWKPNVYDSIRNNKVAIQPFPGFGTPQAAPAASFPPSASVSDGGTPGPSVSFNLGSTPSSVKSANTSIHSSSSGADGLSGVDTRVAAVQV
jgi:hypothetical protein